MPGKVVDCSVIAAIVFNESHRPEAEYLLSGVDLYAPELLAYELAHVAQKKTAEYPQHRGSIAQALGYALDLNIRWSLVGHSRVLDIALSTGLTAYDASYFWISRFLNIELITFDKRLAAVAGLQSP